MILTKDIEIEEFNKNDTDCICVIGCLFNENGKKILNELLSWTTLKYHTYIVYQKMPGNLYEYPALKFAKDISKLYNKPVLYIHTKGAYYNRKESPYIRNIWKELFYSRYNYCYEKIKDSNTLCCPYTGKTKIPWYNGFIASTSAWDSIDLKYNANRFYYEDRLWNKTNVNFIGYFNDKLNNANEMNNYIKKCI